MKSFEEICWVMKIFEEILLGYEIFRPSGKIPSAPGSPYFMSGPLVLKIVKEESTCRSGAEKRSGEAERSGANRTQ